MVDEGGAAPDVAQRIAAAAQGPFEEAWASLDRSLWPPLVSTLGEAARCHAEAVAEAGLAGPGPEGASECSRVLMAYVRGVASDVLAPVLTLLDTKVPCSVVHRGLSDSLHRAERACRALPQWESLPWGNALSPDPSDGVGRRIGKVVARLGSPARKPDRTRDAPIRTVALRHLRDRVIPAEAAAGQDALRAWSQWIGGAERAWSDWVTAALGAVLDEESARGEEADAAAAPGDEEAEAPTVRESWLAVNAAAERLQAYLEGHGTEQPHGAARQAASNRLAASQGPLRADLAVSGSLLFGSNIGPPVPPSTFWASRGPGVDTWETWHLRAVERLRLHQALLHLILGASAIQRRLGENIGTSLQEAVKALPVEGCEAFRELKEELDRCGSSPSNGLETVLDDFGAKAEALLDRFVVPPDEGRVMAPIRKETESAVDGLQGLLRQVPEKLTLHPLPSESDDLRRPRTDTQVIRLQEASRQAFDALRMERIRTSPQVLAAAVETLGDQMTELRDVVAFGFEAARKELAEGQEGAEARALSLSVGGLRRTADALAGLPEIITGAQVVMEAAVAWELSRGSAYIVDRTLARRVQGQILEARSRLSTSLQETMERMAPGARRLARFGRSIWLRLRRRGLRLRRRVRSFMGTDASAHAGPRRFRPPVRTSENLDGVPLVYQRLFTFAPVSDGSLLVGRDVQLAEAEESWTRWRGGYGMPLVVTGPPGSGVSSFFGAVSSRLERRGVSQVRAEFEDRFTSESQLCSWLAGVLGVEAPETLDQLATRVLGAPPGESPEVCILDGLEHAYLRIPGGTDLVERVMTFMAETEPRIFWMASLTRSAWQLVQKSEPTAVSQVEVLELKPLPAEGLRAAVLLRHKRSGVPLVFEEPSTGRHMLRRRLRGQPAHGRQRLLEDDYFDRLHRSSTGNLRLAFFNWLQSADFGTGEGGLRVRDLEPMGFAYLESLDLTQNFTLKSFLEHRTLTLSEHDAVFRIPRQESFQVFESLKNRHIIESLPSQANKVEISDIHENLRYRISPLLTGAVAAHLAKRNIVH